MKNPSLAGPGIVGKVPREGWKTRKDINLRIILGESGSFWAVAGRGAAPPTRKDESIETNEIFDDTASGTAPFGLFVANAAAGFTDDGAA